MVAKLSLYLAWVQAAVATFGSLYFSEILRFPPCLLCWYQRIAMYPLVFLLATGILRRDRNVVFYAFPLTVVGWFIAGYHALLYWKIVPDTLAPCSLGVSCTTKFVEWFGFITIPFLSWLAFSLILVCLGVYYKFTTPERDE